MKAFLNIISFIISQTINMNVQDSEDSCFGMQLFALGSGSWVCFPLAETTLRKSVPLSVLV